MVENDKHNNIESPVLQVVPSNVIASEMIIDTTIIDFTVNICQFEVTY